MSWKKKKKYLDLLDAEEGWTKKLWGEHLRVCLAYPNRYHIGMSNLGFQTVYRLINDHPYCLCERAFYPDDDEMKESTGGLTLISLESQRPVAEFDMVAFSLSFENDYPHILTMLAMAGIPLEAKQRGPAHPLIVGGGIAVTLNPEPIANFFDLFLIGEGETILPEFLNLVTASGRMTEPSGNHPPTPTAPPDREELLARIQTQVEGAYVPRLYRIETGPDGTIASRRPVDERFPVKIIRQRPVSIDDFSTSQEIITPYTELGNVFLVEVSRGCGRGCRFCAAGFACRPVRFRSLETLKPAFERAIELKKTVGLLGTAVSDHPDLVGLCRFIMDRGGKVALGSLRLDRLNHAMAAILKETGVETATFGPEAGSQRLRDAINKGIDEGDILSAVDILTEYGIEKIKLYFMVGLPGETDEDIDAIIDLVKGIQDRARTSSGKRKGFRSITLSINQFIPKAATPFQWQTLADTATVRKRIRRIEQGLRAEKSVRVTHSLPRWNYLQALLALGDRQVGDILLAAHNLNGNWAQAFNEAKTDPDVYVYRNRSPDEILPWDFIGLDVPKSVLLRELARAGTNPGVQKKQQKEGE